MVLSASPWLAPSSTAAQLRGREQAQDAAIICSWCKKGLSETPYNTATKAVKWMLMKTTKHHLKNWNRKPKDGDLKMFGRDSLKLWHYKGSAQQLDP